MGRDDALPGKTTGQETTQEEEAGTRTKAWSMSFRMSAMTWALSLRARTASRECCWMDPRSRAGCPRRTILCFHRASRSTRLSTATLEGAQHRTWGAFGFGDFFQETTSVYTNTNRDPSR